MIFSRFKYGFAFIIALLVTAGTLAFKKGADSDKAVETEWYTLTIATGDDPNDPNDQQITAIEPGQPTGSTCNVSNSGDPCAVHLTSPNPLPMNISVQEALDNFDAEYAGENDYAKEPTP